MIPFFLVHVIDISLIDWKHQFLSSSLSLVLNIISCLLIFFDLTCFLFLVCSSKLIWALLYKFSRVCQITLSWGRVVTLLVDLFFLEGRLIFSCFTMSWGVSETFYDLQYFSLQDIIFINGSCIHENELIDSYDRPISTQWVLYL